MSDSQPPSVDATARVMAAAVRAFVEEAMRDVLRIQMQGGGLAVHLVTLALALCAFLPSVGHAQSYEDIEGTVRRQIEADRARQVGDCSEAMLSWLGMRFSDADRGQGKAIAACAAAQRFALRNRVPFLEALPKVAIAMGGTRQERCPEFVRPGTEYMLYSGCRIPPQPWTPPPPDAWDIARADEVRELGPDVLRHLAKCIPRAGVTFAFNVDVDGRVNGVNDAGDYGRIGPDPKEAAELKRIQRTLETDPRCSVFPDNLRRRYVSIRSDNGKLRVAQVRSDDAHR